MRTLHLACMPFPSPQGTQAVIRQMLDALAAAGHDAHLLVYAHGSATDDVPRDWTLHRLGDFPPVRSLRSGPSTGKVLLDARMVLAARRLARGLRPEAIVAHNVEAALVARTGRLSPRVYFAHTRFDTELPTYLPKQRTPLAKPLAQAGAMLDRASQVADRVVAISPDLAAHLDAPFVPPPWPLPGIGDRHEARTTLGLEGRVALYAGNLDGYQGWETVVDAASEVGDLTLLVATASEPGALRRRAARTRLKLRVVPLDGERTRRRVHAAADVALVSRRAAGGLPVKLLDALARSVPVVATRRATAGLRPRGMALVGDDDPQAMAGAIRELLADRETARALGGSGRRWVAETCAPERFVTEFEAALVA